MYTEPYTPHTRVVVFDFKLDLESYQFCHADIRAMFDSEWLLYYFLTTFILISIRGEDVDKELAEALYFAVEEVLDSHNIYDQSGQTYGLADDISDNLLEQSMKFIYYMQKTQVALCNFFYSLGEDWQLDICSITRINDIVHVKADLAWEPLQNNFYT